ncbi:MAG TPA: hypothetical protein VHQ22_03705 [Terriglobales bacterium]|jgi:hypothetical protein|nr:hypothetical protein [Terriglobales bacterium]
MTIAIVFVCIGLLALALIIYLAKGHLSRSGDLEKLAVQLRPVDVSAFCNLISVSEQEYLRENLPPREFRSIHRERMAAAVEYVRCAAHNASILMRLAEAARQHSDPSVRQAGEKLLENGLRLRLYAIQVIPRVYLSMAFPKARPVPGIFADTYDTMSRQVVTLSCLHFPTHGMSSAL